MTIKNYLCLIMNYFSKLLIEFNYKNMEYKINNWDEGEGEKKNNYTNIKTI